MQERFEVRDNREHFMHGDDERTVDEVARVKARVSPSAAAAAVGKNETISAGVGRSVAAIDESCSAMPAALRALTIAAELASRALMRIVLEANDSAMRAALRREPTGGPDALELREND